MLVDYLLERAADDPKIATRIAEARKLQELVEHPGWAIIERHFAHGSDKFGEGLLSRLLAGEEIDRFEIGWFAGTQSIANAILGYPAQALAKLERTATMMYAAHSIEQTSRQEGYEPYV